jgi:hypothetical protein
MERTEVYHGVCSHIKVANQWSNCIELGWEEQDIIIASYSNLNQHKFSINSVDMDTDKSNGQEISFMLF